MMAKSGIEMTVTVTADKEILRWHDARGMEPDLDGRYLCLTQNFEDNRPLTYTLLYYGSIRKGSPKERKVWYLINAKGSVVEMTEMVVWWMKLPKRPGEEDKTAFENIVEELKEREHDEI